MTNLISIIVGLAFGAAIGLIAAEAASTSTKTNSVPATSGKTVEMPADIAGVPALDVRIGDDPMQRYFLIGLPTNAPATAEPYRLLLVLPGGRWERGFHAVRAADL